MNLQKEACASCGEIFEKTVFNRKYCSIRCKRNEENRRRREKVGLKFIKKCRFCTEEFSTHIEVKEYCHTCKDGFPKNRKRLKRNYQVNKKLKSTLKVYEKKLRKRKKALMILTKKSLALKKKGKLGNEKCQKTEEPIKDKTYTKDQILCLLKEMDKLDVAIELEISTFMIQSWLDRVYPPSPKQMVAVQDYLNKKLCNVC